MRMPRALQSRSRACPLLSLYYFFFLEYGSD
jgi:hypothetical protein